MLIDNLEIITFNFSGSSYKVKRTKLEQNYPKYNEILNNGNIDKDKFNKYVENKMNDNDFVEEMYKLIEEITIDIIVN